MTDTPVPPTVTATPADWEHYRALREQWTHEDHLINHRLMWLILAQGLLFTAYGTLTSAKLRWLVYGFPLFGIAVAFVIGVSIYAALHATRDIEQRFDQAELSRLCLLAPTGNARYGGPLAARSLPFVFGALWVLALFGVFEHGN